MVDADKGCNWLLPLPSKSSLKRIRSALRRSRQKGFENSSLIIAEKNEHENIAILHLKKSIRKGQVDNLLKLKCQRKLGKIDEVKSELKSQGYSVFRRIQISGSERQTGPLPLPKRISPKDCGGGAVQEVPEYSTQNVLRDLLACLEEVVGVDVSGGTTLPQAMKMVRETIKNLMLDSKILFTNIEDLKDDNTQDRCRIRALTERYEGLKAFYEAKLEVKKNQYDELYSQYQNLQARCSHIERRETETMEASYRRFGDWKTNFVSAAP